MTTKCPHCLVEIPEEAKVCKHCRQPVVKRCPNCAEEIAATAKICRFCQKNLEAAPAPAAPAPARNAYADTPVGERRQIVTLLILTVLTCGIYGLVVQYQIGDELNRHQSKNQINPAMDLALIFLTCGLWGIYVMYRYPKILMEISAEEGRPTSDIAVACLLLTIFGMHLVSLMILQSEMNKHWDGHQAAPGA